MYYKSGDTENKLYENCQIKKFSFRALSLFP